MGEVMNWCYEWLMEQMDDKSAFPAGAAEAMLVWDVTHTHTHTNTHTHTRWASGVYVWGSTGGFSCFIIGSSELKCVLESVCVTDDQCL